MSTRLIVDKKEGLSESRAGNRPKQPRAIKMAATFISYIFHPVFVPVYVIAFLVYVHPYLFAGFSALDKTRTMAMGVMMYTFFPLITVLLLKGLKFIDTVYLVTQKDRVIPLIACGVWYFWIWWVWKNLPDYPQAAVAFALATWISVSIGLMANIIMKVSLHAISMGVMLSFFLLMAFSQDLNFGFYISVALLITGLVCTSRFIVSDHEPKEVYGGLVIGFFSVLVGQWLT
jgi:hypothetical protein